MIWMSLVGLALFMLAWAVVGPVVTLLAAAVFVLAVVLDTLTDGVAWLDATLNRWRDRLHSRA
jgi:hypothetical protein